MELWKLLWNDEDKVWLLCLHLCVLLCTFLGCRLSYLMCISVSKTEWMDGIKQPRTKPLKTLIVIGSGGHTMEMLSLIKDMNPNYYSPRIYVMADSDTTSEPKIYHTEELLGKKTAQIEFSKFSILKFPRSRHVGQSFVTSLFSTLFSTFKSIPLMLREKPELILCNGPGTCVPICLIAFVMRVFFLSNNLIIFIESVCRVKSLSLTGRLLYYFADVMLVQWHDLEKRYSRVIYIGRV